MDNIEPTTVQLTGDAPLLVQLAEGQTAQDAIVELPPIVHEPGLVPGGLIETAAKEFNKSPEEFCQLLLTQPLQLTFTNPGGGRDFFRVIPPHPIGGPYGPVRSEVLVVGKHPNVEELDNIRLASGERGRMWKDLLEKLKVDYQSWVYTNVCWFWPDPERYKWKAEYIKEWSHLLARTINTVRPRYMLLFGADAMKAVWSLYNPKAAKGMSFKNTRGAVMDYAAGIKAFVATSPAQVIQDPTTTDDFRRDLRSFADLVRGQSVADRQYTIHEVDHLTQLEQLVDRLIAGGFKRFAIDCEWGHNQQLRTVQFSWAKGEAAVVILRRQGMRPAFGPSIYSAFDPLRRLLNRPGVCVVGHNIRGDLKILSDVGLDLTEEFIDGGFDTMLGYHLTNETAELQLELVAMRLLGMGRYDLELREWIVKNGLKKEDIKELGYGTIPDHILHPYAGMDAIATFELEEPIRKEMAKWPGLTELYTQRVHLVHLAMVEMETTGLQIDEPLVIKLVRLCKEKKDELATVLQTKLQWPDFNPRSTDHVRTLLFSWPKYDNEGQLMEVAPPGAITFQLTPIKTTEDVPWEKVMKLPPQERWRHSPSTDAESVAILSADVPLLKDLRRFKTIDQLAKNFLRDKVEDETTGELEWDKGIGGWINRDTGRLHTSFNQCLETGRYSTRPNCFSADTEILTLRGWVPFPELQPEDQCAQYDTSNGQIGFVAPIHFVSYPYSGKLIHITTDQKQIDLLVTPNHRCLLQHRKSGKFVSVLPEAFPEDYKQLQAGQYVGGTVSYTVDQVTLIAAMQADAHLDPYDNVIWKFSKERKIKRLSKALQALGIKYSTYPHTCRDGKDQTVFYVPHRNIPTWLTDKKFFGSWILQLDRATFQCLSTEIWFWDSCHARQTMYSSAIKTNTDWAQILTVLTGRRAKIRLYRTAADTDNWQIDVASKSYSLTTNRSVTEVAYAGYVYCVTMPKDTVIVRRNGKVAITHNCQNWPKRTEPDVAKCFTSTFYVISRKAGAQEEYYNGLSFSASEDATQKFTERELATLVADQYSASVQERQVLDPRYAPLRSVLIASPGHVLVEADYNQAELWTLGALAKDETFLHTLATSDLHTEMLIKMFGSLAYQGRRIADFTAKELNKLRKSDKWLDMLRTCSKTISFGIPYNRGAGACLREIKKQGVTDRTQAEVKGWIDTFYQTYPRIYDFLEGCKLSVLDPGWLRNPYNRYRRFPYTEDREMIAAFQREACNFPIQSTVGDAMTTALINLWGYRRYVNTKISYRILLSIHDAVLMEVPVNMVGPVVEEVFPQCMVHGVEVPEVGLHYSLGDIDVQLRWGKKADPNELLALGVDRRYCGFKEAKAA